MTNENKSDVNSIITDRLCALLEAGTVPWRKPWRVANGQLPTNFKSKKAYRGINIFMLLCAPFECPYWASFKQVTELGGNVVKGSKGYSVVFWSRVPKKDKTGKPLVNGAGKPEMTFLLRYYTVFNLEQTEGIAWQKPVVQEVTEFQAIESAQKIVDGMPNAPEIRHEGSRACYSPAIDIVYMPKRETFTGIPEYYSTLFHELTHATGHSKRLARKGFGTGEASPFGSDTYGKEELVAEMGASFLCGNAGILHNTISNSASYCANWLKALRSDSKLIVSAAAQAQKASDYILGVTFDPAE